MLNINFSLYCFLSLSPNYTMLFLVLSSCENLMALCSSFSLTLILSHILIVTILGKSILLSLNDIMILFQFISNVSHK